MKTRAKRNRAVAVLGAAVVGVLGLRASGAILSWDPGITDSAAGGSGNWATGSGGWWDGTDNVNWADNDHATFAGTAGSVTVGGGGVIASGLTVLTTGYVLSGGAIT